MTTVHKTKVKPLTIAEEVGELVSKMQIQVKEDKGAVFKLGREITGENAKITVSDMYHDHDSCADLRFSFAYKNGPPIPMQDYDLVLKEQKTGREVDRGYNLGDGGFSFDNVRPGTYALELVKAGAKQKMPGPNLTDIKQLKRK